MDDAQRYLQEHYHITAEPPPGARFAWMRRQFARALAHVFHGQNEFNANVVRALNALRNDRDALAAQCTALHNELQGLGAQHTAAKAALAQAHALLAHHGGVIATLEAQARGTQTALDQLAAGLNARQDALVRMQEQLAAGTAAMAQRHDDLVRVQEQLAEKISAVIQQHTTLVAAQEQLTAALASVTRQHDELIKAQERLAANATAIDQQHAATEERLARDVAGVTKRQDDVVATCAAVSDVAAMLTREHRELVEQLTAAQQATQGTTRRQDALVHSLEQIQMVSNGMAQRHDTLAARLTQLHAELQAQMADVIAREQRAECGFRDLHALVEQLREQTDAVKGGLGALLEQAAPHCAKPAPAALAHAAATLADIAYARFEDAQRGDEASVRERLAWYLPVLTGLATSATQCVLDLGCGRGEFLELLAAHGLHARGVDLNDVAVTHARRKKLRVKTADLFDELRATKHATLAAISAFHVVEHLPFDQVLRLLRLAYAKLRPDGLLLLEMPNILSITVAAAEFYKDPTHVRPLHPVTVQHWLQEAGFTRVAVSFLHPYPAAAQLNVAGDATGNFARLNELLFGSRDCALVAHKLPVASPPHGSL